MTIATTLQQQKKVEKPEVTGATCSIDGGIIRRLIVIIYFLGLVLPTVGVFLIPDPRAFLVYSVYLFFAILCMIPTCLIYLASVDARLVIYRTQSGSLRVKYIDIDPVPTDIAVISKV
ncbi:hypothetical protein PRIPAC_83664 [Pristionchus pacificus]|uniref:Uncharacterized protein n=1 Tax=Pristionchus pacificus TaxID=54126 RepID=A0A454Y3V3_PRIPA|nr:hypothetical protein PRIPAC_83664 [Pristionchus pacificus]|eukprot:PDM68905.1 hypothetical protein PRIPAC_47207 [Pristionchus pacificus]